MKALQKIILAANAIAYEAATIDGIANDFLAAKIKSTIPDESEEILQKTVKGLALMLEDLANQLNAWDAVTDDDAKVVNPVLEVLMPYLVEGSEWISIDDSLPKMLAKDIEKGFTAYEIKNNEELIAVTQVTDHDLWSYDAKKNGVTHWREIR